jgi:hypothetical protein
MANKNWVEQKEAKIAKDCRNRLMPGSRVSAELIQKLGDRIS